MNKWQKTENNIPGSHGVKNNAVLVPYAYTDIETLPSIIFSNIFLYSLTICRISITDGR